MIRLSSCLTIVILVVGVAKAGLGEGLADGEKLELAEGLSEADGDREAELDALGDREADGLLDALGDKDALGLRERLLEALGEREAEGDSDALGETPEAAMNVATSILQEAPPVLVTPKVAVTAVVEATTLLSIAPNILLDAPF